MSNVYLSGNFAPVDEERTDVDLVVRGTIPQELEGRLLRIGPNPVEPDPATYHWFTGNGMVHGLRLRGGRAEWYRNRFVRDDAVVRVKGWPEVKGPRPPEIGGGVANTNVIGHAGRTFAIVEAGNLPVELDEELETLARSDFQGSLPGGFTAHPKRDPDTGELHATVYSPFWDYLQYVVVGVDGRLRKTVNVPVPDKPMVHDCAITQNYFVLLDLPVTFNVSMLSEGASFPYRWNPEHPARVGLLPREGAAEDVIWSEVEPCYIFHPLNAFEDADGRVVLDVVRHPKMFASELLGPNEGAPTLSRWLVDPKGGPVKETLLHERGQEFPRHDERRIGKAYRFGYTAQLESGTELGCLYKHDLQEGRVEEHREGAQRTFLEPVFVPRAADAAEDDGWLLTYVYDADRDASDVVILHAQDFGGEPVASIQLPVRVPYGFHGNWLPDAG